MSKTGIATLKPKTSTLDMRRVQVDTTAARRMTGRALQARRFKVWQKDPHCAMCRCLVGYPGEFQLDHIIALTNGGDDTEENSQVLCIGDDGISGCHAIKTKRDMAGQTG